MDKKILASMLIIAVVAGLVGAGVVSYFRDTETSSNNVFTAGTIDIAVDGENPWTKTYSDFITCVKPCQVRWINFTITNVGDNEVYVWKHIKITNWDGGEAHYPASAPVASSEPEYEECLVNGEYVAKDYLAPWIIYDLFINDAPVITEANELRLDDISCTWIFLGVIQPGEQMKVCQSYHLMTWHDSNVPEVTNWAQGDRLYFDIELYGVQAGGPGPETGVLTLENKNANWEPIYNDGVKGQLIYNLAGSTFDYKFEATGLKPGTQYSLIYYADPWPGCHPGALIATFTTDSSGNIASTSGSASIGFDLPDPGDRNYPAGAKIWLVPSSDYNPSTKSMIAWNPSTYLFGMNLIHYDYTGP
jgi:predicted ribosomally synthesized peptide with SipW-like signal peptide